uniref:Uncharacterized protein n=1 Tax=Cacopsylla melanoneura TaxID=428564 RepID=A0A8D8TZY4_9HEMI
MPIMGDQKSPRKCCHGTRHQDQTEPCQNEHHPMSRSANRQVKHDLGPANVYLAVLNYLSLPLITIPPSPMHLIRVYQKEKESGCAILSILYSLMTELLRSR